MIGGEPDTIEPGRLERAIALLPATERVGPGEYYVWKVARERGSDGKVVRTKRCVNLNIDFPCDCEDSFYRGQRVRGNCKHVLACRMAEGDLAVLSMLGTVLVRRERIAEEVDAAMGKR